MSFFKPEDFTPHDYYAENGYLDGFIRIANAKRDEVREILEIELIKVRADLAAMTERAAINGRFALRYQQTLEQIAALPSAAALLAAAALAPRSDSSLMCHGCGLETNACTCEVDGFGTEAGP